MISRKMNILIPFISFSFSFFIYVHCGCSTIEDNNVIVVLQRQFISHLDRIKSTKHNNNTPYSRFYIFFFCLLYEQLFSVVERKQGWNRYCTTRYPNNILAAAVISTIQRNRYKIKTFLVSKRKTYTSSESICYHFQDNIIWYLSS